MRVFITAYCVQIGTIHATGVVVFYMTHVTVHVAHTVGTIEWYYFQLLTTSNNW